MSAAGIGLRRLHRWVSIAFTLAVVANFAAMAQGAPPAWVTYAPLPPLALLLITGLYLFAQPYLARWRGRAGRADGRARRSHPF